jgi:fructokinase
LHCDATPIVPVSTIGAGDNFNAGVIYGLIKYNIGYHDLPLINEATWDKIIQCGIDFSAEVCQSYLNYISPSN